jgi:hypothetical protein
MWRFGIYKIGAYRRAKRIGKAVLATMIVNQFLYMATVTVAAVLEKIGF